jgi:hypothetical protein
MSIIRKASGLLLRNPRTQLLRNIHTGSKLPMTELDMLWKKPKTTSVNTTINITNHITIMR